MLPRELSKAEVYHSEFPMTIMYLSVCLCALGDKGTNCHIHMSILQCLSLGDKGKSSEWS